MMANTLYQAKVLLIVEHDGQPPVERGYLVMAKSRQDAIKQAYKQLPKQEHDISHVQDVTEFIQQ